MDQSRQLKSYYEAVDIASRSKNKDSKRALDSLMMDSVFLAAGIQLPLFADRLADHRRFQNINAFNASLLLIAMELDSIQEYNSFERLLLEVATNWAEETQNDKALLILNRSNWKVITSDHLLLRTSLQDSIVELQQSISALRENGEQSERKMSERIQLWQILTYTAAFAFVVLFVIFLLVRHSIIKKLRFELSKNLDKSELQILVRKNEDLKNECDQYKQTLEEVIRKMNSLDHTSRSFAGILDELKGMSLESLDFLRQHIEENKSKLSPEIYMGLTNVISRSAAALRDEYQRTIEQLS